MMKQGWEYKKLGEVCEIYQPKTLATEQLVPNGKYLVYGANGIIGRYDEYNHEQSEVLLTCRGATCGTINVSEPFSWINGNAMVIHRKSEEMSFDYLKYLMLSLDYSLIITGAAQPQITRQKLSPTPIKFPPLPVQQQIVSELDLLTSIINKKKAQLDELDKLAQATFYDMFGDPVENEKVHLSDVVTVQNGLVDPQEEPYSSMYHVGPANIVSNTGELINLKLAKDENLISGKYLFKEGMILYSKIRPNLNKVALADFSGICSADMYPLIPKDNVNARYLMHVLSRKDFLDYAIANSGRANIPKINRDALLKYSLQLPAIALQQAFAARIEAIEAQKAKVKETIENLETLLAATMDKYFG